MPVILLPMTKYYSVITLVLNKCIFHLLYLAMILCVFTLQYCLIDVHRMNLSWNLFHPSINFKLGLQKERFGYWNKNGGWSGGWLPKGYPICTDNSSSSFQYRKSFADQLYIPGISENVHLLGFWYLIVYEKNTYCSTLSFLFLHNVAYRVPLSYG